MPLPLIIAGVAAAGSIGGAIISSGAQKSVANQAAAAQQQATDSQLQLGRENIGFQQGIYNQNKALLNPFVQRGDAAGNQINSMLGLGGQSAPQQVQPGMAPQPGAQQNQIVSQEPLASFPSGYASMGGGEALGMIGDGHGDGALSRFFSPQANQSVYDPAGTINANPQVQQPQNAMASPQSNPQSAQDAFSNFANSAGMQFQLKQGTNALNNMYAGRGSLLSGAAMKGIQNYGQQTALNNYFMPYMGLLQGQQATGAQSGAAIAGVGSNFGNTVSSIYGGQQNAIGNGADAISNAALLRGQANSNFGNSLGSALGGLASSFVGSGFGGGSGYNAYNAGYTMPVNIGASPLSMRGF